LFSEAVKTKGNLEPYLQQLQAFDAREINHCRDLMRLSEDIAYKGTQIRNDGKKNYRSNSEVYPIIH
jgi:hypothetical protein